MNSPKRQTEFGVNIGTSSLLLVFVILCLVSFATLTIVSATADAKLNDKVIERSQAYYDACTEANEKLMSIDESLKNAYETCDSKVDYYTTVGKSITFCLPISDIQSLQVEAVINYPEQNGDTFYTITKWALQTTGSLEADESLGLMTFED